MVEPTADNPNTGLFIALGAIGILAGGAVIYLATQPAKTGTTNNPPPGGLNCAATGQSCASVACCLGAAACDPSDQICLAPGTSSSCAQVGDSCQNTICCGEKPNVVCASNTCVVTQNLTCSNCTPPNICNAGVCSGPTVPCTNCTGVIDHCDASTGICIHPCDPPCANTGDCDMSNCGNPPYDGCGVCSGPPAEWNISGLTLAPYSTYDVPVVGGDVVDVNISFNYTGPGGNIQVGYNAWLEGDLVLATVQVCTVTLTDYNPVWIEPTQYGGYESYYTAGLTWPQMTCFFCDGCAGVVSDQVYAQPFVITPDGQTWTGATVQGLFCC